ncbi:MAG: hypothetical protein IIB43_06185 [Candidatus Marinimicrobia bacterium]|nr:hypothetical protein [Candidatus Neomarinimicrobiota bacterium]
MADPDLSIGPAVAGDLPAIVQLLGRSGLEADGLEQHLDTTLVARRHGQLVASAGLELYGRQALMRSVVVAPQLQGTGLGGIPSSLAFQCRIATKDPQNDALVYELYYLTDKEIAIMKDIRGAMHCALRGRMMDLALPH